MTIWIWLWYPHVGRGDSVNVPSTVMSFLVPSQRGLVQQTLTEFPSVHNHPDRSQLPLSSFQGYPHPHQGMPSASNTCFLPPLPPDPMAHTLPKLGETRCYWSLLSSDLSFIYLDPILANHLDDQAPLLLGKSLLYFVHPDEQETARNDLTDALEQKTMHGSVTRVRYCRLPKVRRILGYVGMNQSWNDADKASSNEYYMPVDIVISWAAEGLVLCFIHAVPELDLADNNEHPKSPWATWCGTPMMNSSHLQLLYQRLHCCCPQPGVLSKVFQILTNSSNQDYQLLFTWPPDTSHEYSNKPSAKDFARRAEGVLPSSHDGNVKTNCTKRWRIGGTMPAINGEVESVFIPHGAIMFACHTIQPNPRNGVGTPSHPQYPTRTNESHVSHTPQHAYDMSANSYTFPPVSASIPTYNHLSNSLSSPYPSQSWTGHTECSSLLNYNRWPNSSSTPMASIPGSCPVREATYGVPSPCRPGDSPTFGDLRAPQHGYSTPANPNAEYIDRRGSDISGLSSSFPDGVPPPRRRGSPGVIRDVYSRPGNRPVGTLKCTSCKTTQSPEWRKGPSGRKELCNACGLRYARSRAKKEGHVVTGQRRKKEKPASVGFKEDSIHPQSPPIAIAGATARSTAFESSSVGSASGSEIYSQHSPVATEASSSPPSLNFVHYSHPPPARGVQPRSDRRSSFQPSGSFQAAPSPLATQQTHRSYRNREDTTPLSSRFAPYSGYVSSTTSANASPVGTLTPLPSFERDKVDDRYLAPPPGSSEAKYDRFTMAMQR